jgi:hypothetical protein
MNYQFPNDLNLPADGFYSTLSAMLSADIPPDDEIIFGLGRGDVGQLASVTNAGKTTLILNTCLSIAAGVKCLPLAPDVKEPRRVLYVDFEGTRSKTRGYLEKLRKNFSKSQQDFIDANLSLVVDVTLDDEPLSLSSPNHLARVIRFARDRSADLVAVDTVSAAFDMVDENSNAEVKRAVMKPLKRLAREANAAVIFCHHSGKPSEHPTTEHAYAGRGASTFGGLSRAVFTLTKATKVGPDFLTLRCAKVKGDPFDPVLLRLNRESGWFKICAEKPPADQGITVRELVDFIASKGEVKRREYLEHFKGRASAETLDERRDEALKLGMIERVGHGRFRITAASESVN